MKLHIENSPALGDNPLFWAYSLRHAGLTFGMENKRGEGRLFSDYVTIGGLLQTLGLYFQREKPTSSPIRFLGFASGQNRLIDPECRWWGLTRYPTDLNGRLIWVDPVRQIVVHRKYAVYSGAYLQSPPLYNYNHGKSSDDSTLLSWLKQAEKGDIFIEDVFAKPEETEYTTYQKVGNLWQQ